MIYLNYKFLEIIYFPKKQYSSSRKRKKETSFNFFSNRVKKKKTVSINHFIRKQLCSILPSPSPPKNSLLFKKEGIKTFHEDRRIITKPFSPRENFRKKEVDSGGGNFIVNPHRSWITTDLAIDNWWQTWAATKRWGWSFPKILKNGTRWMDIIFRKRKIHNWRN